MSSSLESGQSTAVSGSAIAPSTPSGLTTTNNVANVVNLAWTAVTGATYNVYRSADNVTFTSIATPTSNSYSDTSGSVATYYYYKVTSVINSAESAKSASVSGNSIPATVTGLTASTNQVGSVNLAWTTVPGTTYLIYRSTISGGSYPNIGTSSSNSYSDNSVSVGVTYYYKVQAVKNGFYGAVSSFVSGNSIPAAVAGLSASTNQVGSVNLSWTTVTGATYKVYRSLDNVTFASVATPSSNSYADSTVTTGVTYYYKVSSVISGTEGAQSTSVYGYSIPATVIGLTASTSQVGGVNLSWPTITGATYKVYRSSDNVTFASIATPSGNNYADFTVAAGTTYYYKVSSVINGVESAQSASVSGYSIPATVTGLAVSPQVGQNGLSWTAVPSANSYTVYRAASSTGTYSTIGSPSTNGFIDTTGTVGTTYYYKVSATTNSVEGGLSAAVSGASLTAAVPVGLTASNNQVGSVSLSWTTVSGATYKVYRSTTSGGAYTAIASLTSNSYSDSSVTAGTTYWYKVTSVANGVESAQSASVSGVAISSTVAGLTATTDQVGSVNLSWTAIPGATYTVYRSSNGDWVGANYTLLSSSNNANYSDTSVMTSAVYYYKITATLNSTEGAQSAAVSGYSIPAAPTNLSASSLQTGGVGLSWTATTSASQYGASYLVYRATSVDGVYASIGSSTSTSYTDTSGVVGTNYWYKVSAKIVVVTFSGTGNSSTNNAESAQTAAVSAYSLPVAPSGLTASNDLVDRVDLAWTAMTGATYNVYRSSDNVNFAAIAMPSSNGYSDASATAGTIYYYKLSSVVSGVESALSASVQGTAASQSPVTSGAPITSQAPAGLSATQGTVTGHVQLAWTPINGVSRYGVYRDGVQLGLVTSAFYEDALNEVSVHSYTVTSVSGNTESAPSSAVTGYANRPPTSIIASGTTKTDELVTITPIISDPNSNDVFTLGIAAMPAHGGVSLQNGSFVYQSNANWSGIDGFDVTVTDKAGASVGGHVSVVVNGVKESTPYRFIIKQPQ